MTLWSSLETGWKLDDLGEVWHCWIIISTIVWFCKHMAGEMRDWALQNFLKVEEGPMLLEDQKLIWTVQLWMDQRAPEEDVIAGTKTAFGHSAKATDSVPTAAELHRRHCTCDTQPAALSQRPPERRLEVPGSPAATSGSALAVFAPTDCPGQGYLQGG